MAWTPTHRVPPGGLATFVNNQPSTPLDAGLDVQLLEWSGEWARVIASNGWECWVNGQALIPLAAPPLSPPAAIPAQPPAAAPAPPQPTPAAPPAYTPPPAPPTAQPPVPMAAGYSAVEPSQKKGGPPWIPILIGIIVLLLVVGAAGGGYLYLNASASDVTLEMASSQSASPFQPSLSAAPASSPSASPTAAPAPPPSGPNGLAIYGGSGNNAVCDKQKMIDFLTTHSAEASAWAGVLAISTSQIPDFVRQLTPEILSKDVRVTNHGFANGKATTYQSVFQAGTAVLVNQYGYPVVRCLCGNPLTPPISGKRYRYTGQKWSGFSETTIIIYVAPPGNVPNVPTAVPTGTTTKPTIGPVTGNFSFTLVPPAQTSGDAAALGLDCTLSGQKSFPARLTQDGNQLMMVISSAGTDVTLTGTVDPLGAFDLTGNFASGSDTIGITYKGNIDVTGNWDGLLSETFTTGGKSASCSVRVTATKA